MATKGYISQPRQLSLELEQLISSAPLLTGDEERALALDGSDPAREQLVLSHLRLVKSIAFSFNAYSMDVEDLFDQGVVGLLKAIDRYTPARGRLATFARHFIWGEILCYLNKNQGLLYLPGPLQRSVNKFRRVCRKLGESATDAAIAAEMACPVESVSYFRECSEHNVENLDMPLADSDEGQTLGNTLGSVDPGFAQVEAKLTVAQLLSHLSPVEREVIRLRHALDGGAALSLRAVGKRFFKSHEWVAKVEKTALAKMRKRAE